MGFSCATPGAAIHIGELRSRNTGELRQGKEKQRVPKVHVAHARDVIVDENLSVGGRRESSAKAASHIHTLRSL